MTAVPGLTPRSPETSEGPVLVTVLPASTAKEVAVPNPTPGWAAVAVGVRVLKLTIAAVVATARSAVSQRVRTKRIRGGLDPR